MLPVPCQYIFSLIFFIVNNDKNFEINQYTVLMQGVYTIFID